jgi:subtilisin family serine protease
VIAEVLGQLTPARLLLDPRATGEGVRVAVLDTGIDRARLEAKYRAAGLAPPLIEGGVFVPGRAEPLPYDGRASAPHGTTVADILLTVAPRIQLFSADVFGPQGASDVETVVHALRWAMDRWQCRVLNLSLGVPEHRLQQLPRRHHLLAVIEEAYFRDAIICAAAHNEHPLTRSYPAEFGPPLLGVDKRVFAGPLEFAYALRHHIEFQAHGRGYLGPFHAEPATSWATPHLAGIAARLLSLRPELKPFEVKTLLYWLSRHYTGNALAAGNGGPRP